MELKSEKVFTNPRELNQSQILCRGKYQYKQRLARLSQNPNIRILATGPITKPEQKFGFTHFINYEYNPSNS
jgi:hypothetical protein